MLPEHPQCNCRRGTMIIRTSWTQKNYGRKFYTCPLIANQCGDFIWVDDWVKYKATHARRAAAYAHEFTRSSSTSGHTSVHEPTVDARTADIGSSSTTTGSMPPSVSHHPSYPLLVGVCGCCCLLMFAFLFLLLAVMVKLLLS